MNLCFFSAKYLPSIGGVERYTAELAKQVSAKGHKVTIVTSNVDKLSPIDYKDNIRTVRLPCINLLKGRFPVPLFNIRFFNLLKIVFEEEYDCVLVQTRFYLHSLIGVKAAYRMNIPSMIIEHGTSHFTIDNKVLDKLGHRYEHYITRQEKKYCHNYYGVSVPCCDWLKHFGIEAKGTMYNAVNISEIKQCSSGKMKTMAEAIASKYDNTVIFTGRLVKEKGIIELIEAVKVLNANGTNVALLIVGDGPLKKTIEDSSEEFVICTGELKHNDAISLLKKSDIFCLPSYSEGFSTSVLEAAACKTFIVTTDTGGSAELLLDDTFGIVMSNHDVDTIAASIKRAIEDKPYRKAAEDKTYYRLVKFFTWEKIAEKYLDRVRDL